MVDGGGHDVRASDRTVCLAVRRRSWSVEFATICARGDPKKGRLILFLHGTQDSSITFQFVVEHLRDDWCVVAPDWRGHGHSQWVSQGYWLHEFVADLDVLVDALFS